jgi:hypothetical protein
MARVSRSNSALAFALAALGALVRFILRVSNVAASCGSPPPVEHALNLVGAPPRLAPEYSVSSETQTWLVCGRTMSVEVNH